MKLPRKIKQWAREAVNALGSAVRLAVSEYGELNQQTQQHLYKYCPMLCAKKRGIKDKDQIVRISRYSLGERLSDFNIDPESKEHYSINFLLAYLDSHVALDVISEQKVHEVMEYIVENSLIEQ
jgi:hypothetical protein